MWMQLIVQYKHRQMVHHNGYINSEPASLNNPPFTLPVLISADDQGILLAVEGFEGELGVYLEYCQGYLQVRIWNNESMDGTLEAIELKQFFS
jgi:hypothetical protein